MLQSLASWLVAGVLLLGFALVLFMFLYRVSRRSPHAWLVSEVALSSLFVPLVVVLIAFGAGSVLAAFSARASSPITAYEALEAAVVLGVAVVLAVLLKRGAGGLFDMPSQRARAVPIAPRMDRAA